MSPTLTLSPETRERLASVGLLVLRASAGLMMALNHGWPKLSSYAAKAATFADPLGVGSRISMALAIFSELFCSILVILGLATRVAALPLVFTMLMAAIVIHADDSFGRKELALTYATAFLAVALAGPGRYSLDALIGARQRASGSAGR